jgi:hypothetical protein
VPTRLSTARLFFSSRTSSRRLDSVGLSFPRLVLPFSACSFVSARLTPHLSDIPHCSIARWFTTLFDASNTLLTLDIPAPVEEYIFTDDTSSQPLVRGTRLESPRVCWVFRNTACGSVVRTYGWLRAVMTPDFGQGVLKIERLEVYYQVAEEFVPRHLAARLERDSKPEEEDEDERGEVVAGFEGMVRRRNFKPSVELPPPLGPYGVSEQVLRFLEVSRASERGEQG